MNSISLIFTIVISLFLLFCKRENILYPFICAACFLPMNQRFIILSLDFTVLRVLVLVGLFRILAKGESRPHILNDFDKLFYFWMVIGASVFTARYGEVSAAINRAGALFDSIGMYLIFRNAIDSFEALKSAIKAFAFFAIVTAPLIIAERWNESSFFSIFGPVAGQYHRGRFRAAGPFPHYIMMGAFWSSLLPLFYAIRKTSTEQSLFTLAIIGSLTNVILCASSTPLLSILSMGFFWLLYNYRHHGGTIFWLCVLLLTWLHLIMNTPVWHLLARVNVFGGSTGWHRYHLFNEFINHMKEWIIFGTNSTAHWGWGLQDITNQFVLEGVRGGGISLLLFSLLIYKSVKIPGVFSTQTTQTDCQILTWGVSTAMFGHFVTFWGVSYFGQINMLLSFMFAVVAFIAEKQQQALPEPKPNKHRRRRPFKIKLSIPQ